jgi:hypothetical protein
MGDAVVPEAYLERWAQGEVLVGLNEWRKGADFKAAVIKEHNLVDVGGKLMTAEQARELKAQQLVVRPDAAPVTNEVTRALEGLQIGAPVSTLDLTIYPLVAPSAGKDAPFVPLHAALATGKFELSEGGVFSVKAANQLDQDVLLLAGEVLTGGRCARAVAQDTLVPKSRTSSVPVVCVEPGAWRGDSKFAAESGHYVAPPGLRNTLAWGQGQGAVWSQIARRLDKDRAGQPDLFKKHRDALVDFMGRFGVLPERDPGAVGVAVAIGDGLDHVEIFQNPALFRAYFDRLLKAAALDVLERPADGGRSAAFPNTVKGVKQFLESAFFSAYDVREDGFVVRKDTAWRGRACVTAAGLHHAVLFAAPAPAWDRRAAVEIPKEKMKAALAEYEKRFKDGGPLARAAILQEMGSLGARDAVPLLLSHVADADPAVRRAAVRELGGSGDPRATMELKEKVLVPSRKEPMLFEEVVKALARLGHEPSVDPLLKQLDGSDPDLSRTTLRALPELLREVRNRDLLDKAVSRLIRAYEAADSAAQKGDRGQDDPMTRGVKQDDARLLADAVRLALVQITGLDHDRPAPYSAWWSDGRNKKSFLDAKSKP